MRRPLSLVLVLLLVLRGLLGNAMAMGAAPVPGVHPAYPAQAVPAAPAPHQASGQAHHHAPEPVQAVATAAAPEDAHGTHAAHGHEAPHHGADAGQALSCADDGAANCGAHEHGPGCTLCGICHSAWFSPGGIAPHGAFSCAGLRPLGSERFASAALPQAIKPPIS